LIDALMVAHLSTIGATQQMLAPVRAQGPAFVSLAMLCGNGSATDAVIDS
jgi:hypothetical protein